MIIESGYQPLKRAVGFHASPAKFRLIRGGKGSGKTNALLMEAWMLSQEYPGNVGLLARETVGELQEIIIDPILNLIPPELIAEHRKADKKLTLTNGSMIYFRPLDESRKFKGLNLGWFGIDELDAAKQEDWLQLIGQLRKPGVRHAAIGTTNPTSMDHWIYEEFVKNQLPDHEDFVFPTTENPYLPDDFVPGLLRTMPESWVRRYLNGEWGTISLGDRVYPGFSDKLHIYDNLQYNPSLPVIRAWDFGLRGHAVIFAQRRGALGLDILGEIFKKDMVSRQFATVTARYCEEHFPKALFEDYGDVAGNHRDATSGRSPIEEISDELHTRIKTQMIELKDSIDLVRTKLGQIVEGNSALRFNNKQTRLSVEALNGGYVYKKDRLGNVVADTPASDEVFEHLMDSLRYMIWWIFAYSRPEKRKFTAPTFKPTWEGSSW